MTQEYLIKEVVAAMRAFRQAKRSIEMTFSRSSAPEIVSEVLAGHRPRSGVCDDGSPYQVHGIGYTVVGPSGSPVHIDGSESGDSFTVYDLKGYLDAELDAESDLDEILSTCRHVADQVSIRQVGPKTFVFES